MVAQVCDDEDSCDSRMPLSFALRWDGRGKVASDFWVVMEQISVRFAVR